MIPNVSNDLQLDFEIAEQPNKTYKLDTNSNIIVGFIDGLEAVKQAIYLMLNIERYEHLIYSWNYGIELIDLYGQPPPLIQSEIKRRITEALTQDSRIISVDAFSFETNKGKVHVTFTVKTIYGEVDAETEVSV